MLLVPQLKPGDKFVYGKDGGGVGNKKKGELWGKIRYYAKGMPIIIELADGEDVEFSFIEISRWVSEGVLVLEENDEINF